MRRAIIKKERALNRLVSWALSDSLTPLSHFYGAWFCLFAFGGFFLFPFLSPVAVLVPKMRRYMEKENNETRGVVTERERGREREKEREKDTQTDMETERDRTSAPKSHVRKAKSGNRARDK